MNPGTVKLAALSTSIALLLTSCADLTPGENASVFGTFTGVAAATIAKAAGASDQQALLIGAAAGAVAGMTAYIIAKHQATERQRRIAEARARIYYGRLAASKKVAMKKRKVRYIAVDTEKDAKTSPKAKKAVMIYDTEANSMVGDTVYDVQTPPKAGTVAKFDTYSAEYVGSSN